MCRKVAEHEFVSQQDVLKLRNIEVELSEREHELNDVRRNEVKTKNRLYIIREKESNEMMK